MGFSPWPTLSKHGPVSISKDWVICITEPVDPARDGWNQKFGSGIVLTSNMQLNG
jgi:hypothetical protein